MHTSQVSCGRARCCGRGPQPGAGVFRAASPAAVTRPTINCPQHQRKHATSASAVPDATDDKAYVRDELADYEELLRQKKASKREALEAAIRKRKLKTATAQEQQPQSAAADTAPSSGISTAAQQAAASPAAGPLVPSGARFAARPRAVPAALQRQQQRQNSTPVAPAAAEVQVADADVITETSAEGLPPDDVLKAMLEELLEGEAVEEGEEEAESPMAARQQRLRPAAALPRRRTPAQIRATNAARRAAQRQLFQQQQQQQQQGAASNSGSSTEVDKLVPVPTYNDRKLAQLAAKDPNAAALQQMLAAAADNDDGDEDELAESESGDNTADDDDLDWEALGQYEQLEQYLGDLQKQEASPARSGRPAAAAAAAAAPVFPTSAPTNSSSRSSSSIAKSPTAAQKKLKRVPAGTAARQFEKDLDELEQFVSLFEAMEKAKAGSSNSDSKLQRPQQSSSSADPGEELVAALLGQDWEAELLDELAAVVDEEQDQEHSAGSGSSEQQQQLGLDQSSMAAAAAADEEPWADDVTGLLLGLVTISHERYLKSPIPLPDIGEVPEDQRCNVFWSAPWALLVTDDSGQYNMEYVNESAGCMLGGGYLDLFGQPAYEIVADSLEAQSDWAYAVQRVEESVANCARIPQLELRDLSGQPVIARDVSMWRVDSLEDTAIGMAVLVKSWERK